MSYTSGIINIPNVTGNIVITATATIATVSSISAVFSQGQNVVYDTDSLDTLKQYLTVTATYADTSTAVVTNYSLSGTLTAGTSTVTVSYGGKTDTFTVTVSSGSTSVSMTFIGSGGARYTQVIDARNADVYWTFPYIEGSAEYASGATSTSDFLHIKARCYNDAEGQNLVGFYYIDTQALSDADRTDLNCPSMPVDTPTLMCPAGYYVQLYIVKRAGFYSNATAFQFIENNCNSVTLRTVRS